MKNKKFLTLKEAANILNIPLKTVYSRINSKKYKECFIKRKKKTKKIYIYYKYKCIKKELNEKVTKEDILFYVKKYYNIIELIKKKFNLSDNISAEKKLRQIIKKEIHKIPYLQNHTNKRIYQITDCTINNKQFLLNIINFFNELETKIKD